MRFCKIRVYETVGERLLESDETSVAKIGAGLHFGSDAADRNAQEQEEIGGS